MSELAAEAPDTGIDAAASGAEAGSGPVDGTASAAPSVETTGQAPAWTPDNPDFQAAVDQRSEQKFLQLLQTLQEEQAQQQQQSQAPPEFDMLDPEQVQAFFAYQQQQQQQQQQQLLQHMQQILAPILGQHQSQVLQEGTQRIHDIVESIATRDGDFTTEGKTAVADTAPLFLEQMESVYGPGARAAEAAIQQAAKVVRAIESAAGAKAVEQYKNQLSNVASAPGSVGQSGASGLQSGPPATNLRELGRRFASQVNG